MKRQPVASAATAPGGEDHEHRAYWERFYASAASSAVPQAPSAFAAWVAQRDEFEGPVVDVGTGTGRDALWFSGRGFDVLGLDYAESAVARAAAAAREQGVDARFDRLDLYHLGEVADVGERIAREVAPNAVYARFVVHALEDDGRGNLWRLARTALGSGGRLYLEFRVAETAHVFGEHYRHFVASDLVADEIGAEGGRIEHHEVGYGLAVYKTEDPKVARLVARW